MGVEERKKEEEEKKSMIIVVPSCLKDADGARTRSDQFPSLLSLPVQHQAGSLPIQHQVPGGQHQPGAPGEHLPGNRPNSVLERLQYNVS